MVTREYNYVTDTCKGFFAMAECNETIGKEINIASNYEISIYEVLKALKEIMNCKTDFIIDKERIRPESSEVFRLWGDNSLLLKLTGFRTEVNIRTGLEITCKWFAKAENLRKYKASIYNL